MTIVKGVGNLRNFTYDKFVYILEKHLHKDEKIALLKSLAENPNRFVGIFRPTNPKTKIRQFLTQSGEIRFGDAMEEIITEFLKDSGYTILERTVRKSNGELLNIDQHFQNNKGHYFIEQKVRDDHDSTKKRGQLNNFKEKYYELKNKYGNIIGIMYFIDPFLKKNRNYYLEELENMKKQGEHVYLFYGKELFKFLKIQHVWDKLIEWLKTWRQNIPELMKVDFDLTADESFHEIKNLEFKYWRKIIFVFCKRKFPNVAKIFPQAPVGIFYVNLTAA
jgi:hypothetical protein